MKRMRIWLYSLLAAALFQSSLSFHPPPVHRFATARFLSGANGDDDPSSNVADDPNPNPNVASFGNSICRVVASSDGKLPSSKSSLPAIVQRPPYVLDKLDMIYHSLSHEETRKLEYLETEEISDVEEEKRLISVLRTSLEDAGFQRLTQRDLDLCDSLNAGYLLRLSIQPDVSELDPSIAAEMYPELMTENGTSSELLFEGRVLVYRRGYSSETTKGRLLLPKVDYLQASLVQESALRLTQQLGKVERATTRTAARIMLGVRVQSKAVLDSMAGRLLPGSVGTFARNKLGWKRLEVTELKEEIRKTNERENVLFKLGRYGGSKIRFVGTPKMNNALTPFLICLVDKESDIESTKPNGSNEDDATHDIYKSLNTGDYTCQYDSEHPDRHHKGPLPSTLLERISIGNVVDVFSSIGRRRMLTNFLSKVELVEPTYDEVFVIWRPLRKKTTAADMTDRIPKAVYNMAEIFDMEHKLPEKPDPDQKPRPTPLKIRAFNGVPMANLPGVFPKTRLVFRPADALLFDPISVLTLVLVLGSQSFDNPKLDLVAIISVSLWLFRTVIRYSNKLARYDLLVKNFLTSKIAHRGSGAVKYISNEAASQRATRAALLHSWLTRRSNRSTRTRDQLIDEAFVGVNEMLENDKFVDIDVVAGLKDLEALELISFSEDGSRLLQVADEGSTVDILKSTWSNVFDGELVGMASQRNQTGYP